jgi:hypothetical protein
LHDLRVDRVGAEEVSGGILDVSADAYHRDEIDERPSLSKSIIHLLVAASPAHAKQAHPRLTPDVVREDDPKFDLGTAAHSLFLQGIDNVAVIPYDDWRTKAAKEEREIARQYGKTPMLAAQWDECQTMVDAVRKQLARFDCDPPLFTDGQPEQTLVWEEGDVLCRARLDWLRDDLTAIDDMKTTRASANPDAWAKTMYGMGADLQVAWYLRGARAVLNTEPQFRFVVCEVVAPYAVSAVTLAPDSLALANRKIDYAISLWRRCLATGVWPSYPARLAHVEAPGWAEAAWLERELREVAA